MVIGFYVWYTMQFLKGKLLHFDLILMIGFLESVYDAIYETAISLEFGKQGGLGWYEFLMILGPTFH